MAEITEIELKVKTDTAGLKDIQKEFDKTSKAIQRSNEDIHSSFEQLNNDISLFQKYVEELDKSSSTFSQNSQKAFKEVGKTTDELSEKFKNLGLILAAGIIGPEFVDVLKFAIEKAKTIFENRKLISFGTEIIGPLLKPILDEIKSGNFRNAGKIILDQINEFIVNPLKSLLGDTFNELKNKFDQLLELVNRVRDFGKLKIDQFSEFVNQLREAGRLKFDQISNSLKSFTDDIVKFAGEFFKNAPGIRQLIILFERLSSLRIPPQIAIPLAIAAAIPTIILLIKHWDELDEIIGQIPEAISKINEEINHLIQTSIAFMSGVLTGLTQTVSGVWEGAKEKASEAWDEIKGVVSGAVETIKGYYGGISESLSDVWKSAKETTSNAWKSIEQRVSNGVRAIKETLGGIKESATKAFEDVFGGTEAPPVTLPKPQMRIDLVPLNPQIREELEKEREEFERTNKAIDDQTKLFPPLNNALAMAGGEVSAFTLGQGDMSDAVNGVMTSVVSLREKGIDPLTGQTDELADRIETASGQVEQAEGTFNTYGISLGNVNDLNKVFGVTQEQVNQSLEDGSVAFDSAGASAEEFGNTIDQVQNSGGFFEGIKQGFKDFVENVQSNSELMADFFADTLSQMSQNFSDLFFNVLTGKFDDLKDLAKQAFEAILRSFLDLVSAIATRQIVLSIGGLFGLKGEQQGGGNPVQAGQQAIGAGTNIAGLFGSGGAFATLGAGLGLSSSAAFTTAAGGGAALLGTGSFAAGGSVGASLAETAATPGLLATAGAAITIIGAALAAAALVVTLILPLLKKTPHFAFKFESIKTDIGERAALVKEFLDPELFSDEIFKTLSSHGGGGAFSGKERDKLKDAIQKAIADTIQSIQDIINKLPADMAAILNDALLNTAVDMESKIGRSNLLGFDAKGAKNIQDKLEKFLQGDLQGRFLESIRSFFQEAFVALGALPEKAQAVIDEQFAAFQKAGSPEARAEIGKALLDQFNAFVDAFNIVSGNVNDAIGQTIQGEEFESRLAA